MTTDDPQVQLDDSFFEGLRAVLTEAAPSGVEQAAAAALDRGPRDRPALPAIYDSVFEGVPIGVRGAGPRLITFETEAASVEVEVVIDRTMRIVGQVVPPAAGEVTVEAGGESQRVALDDLGGFVVHDVASGPLRIVVRCGDLDIETDWIVL